MDQSLVPVSQRLVAFYEDEIPVVVVLDDNGEQVPYVPIRPICDYLGIDWSAQNRRIRRDPVLDEEAAIILVVSSDVTDGSNRPKASKMLCLPLDFLNGWLMGLNANRVHEDLRERMIAYQRKCYRVLAREFSTPSSPQSPLEQVQVMGLAIATMAQEQIEFDKRLTTIEATIATDISSRIYQLEERLQTGEFVTDEQAAELSQAVKAVAVPLTKKLGSNQFGAVYGELYRKFGCTSYKKLPAKDFGSAMSWLREMYQQSFDEDVPF